MTDTVVMAQRRVGLWLIGACGGVASTTALGLSALARGLTSTTGMVTALPQFAGHDFDEPTGPWSEALAQLRAWEPAWAEACERMATNPWRSGVLPSKLVELIGVAVNVACTNLNPEGTRRHIRGALEAGATQAEVLMVLRMASLLAIHSCSIGAPILLEEAKAAGARTKLKAKPATPPTLRTQARRNQRGHGEATVSMRVRHGSA